MLPHDLSVTKLLRGHSHWPTSTPRRLQWMFYSSFTLPETDSDTDLDFDSGPNAEIVCGIRVRVCAMWTCSAQYNLAIGLGIWIRVSTWIRVCQCKWAINGMGLTACSHWDRVRHWDPEVNDLYETVQKYSHWLRPTDNRISWESVSVSQSNSVRVN